MGNKYIIDYNDFKTIGLAQKIYRIKAVKGFNLADGRVITTGQLGGYIQSEHNLSQGGNCWVDKDAFVYDNAVVSGDALICDTATVCNYTIVQGNAVIKDNAVVNGKCHIIDNSVVGGKSHINGCTQIQDLSIVMDSNITNSKIFGESRVINSAVIDYINIKNSKIISCSFIAKEKFYITNSTLEKSSFNTKFNSRINDSIVKNVTISRKITCRNKKIGIDVYGNDYKGLSIPTIIGAENNTCIAFPATFISEKENNTITIFENSSGLLFHFNGETYRSWGDLIRKVYDKYKKCLKSKTPYDSFFETLSVIPRGLIAKNVCLPILNQKIKSFIYGNFKLSKKINLSEDITGYSFNDFSMFYFDVLMLAVFNDMTFIANAVNDIDSNINWTEFIGKRKFKELFDIIQNYNENIEFSSFKKFCLFFEEILEHTCVDYKTGKILSFEGFCIVDDLLVNQTIKHFCGHNIIKNVNENELIEKFYDYIKNDDAFINANK